MPTSPLDRFRPEVRTWFTDVFARPTAVQEQAWAEISTGGHALVVAPTGSGKTLAAFLWALNSLTGRPRQALLPISEDADTMPVSTGTDGSGVKVLYISPLKALGVDVENNLRAPLTGIARAADRLGVVAPTITVGVRSGDTPAKERARQQRNPPDILITTPESLYLMLTSKAAGTLTGVRTVIIDEIHALAGTKRGVHLALSLERLELLTERPVQRIGLSATVRPLERVAAFLGGTNRDVAIIAPGSEKRWELDVHVPVPDMSDLPTPEHASTIGDAVIDDPDGLTEPLDATSDPEPAASTGTPQESALPTAGSIWPFIETELYAEITRARSTLVFVNSRRTAERLTSRLNEIHAEKHDPGALSAPTRRPPAQVMKSVDVAGKADTILARAHHGSVSKEERARIEEQLKSGELTCVVATSSLELGIDMGAVDLVIQVASPPSVAAGLQRVGRAGHTVGAVSRGSFYPQHRSDLVQSAVTVERMRAGAIEELTVPRNPLDVLTQQTVATVAARDIHVDEWYEAVRRAHPYATLAREVFDAVIDLASGVYPSTDFAELRPRVVYDRVTGMLTTRPGAQRVAVTSGGTIPDRGMFGVFLAGTTGEGGGAPRRVGELDEEMVYETRVGDVFTLGASSWRVEEITRDQVIVTPAPGHTGRLPFWIGDQAGRPAELGAALGAFRREVAADPARAAGLGLDTWAHENLTRYLAEQADATGIVPDEKTLLLERFTDELGDWRIILHTPYGRGVNAAWALAVGARIAENTGMDAQVVAGDDGIVLRLPDMDGEPGADLFTFDADDIEDLVTREVGNSALFASRFRECAARALLLPRRAPGKRAPLWQQRQRSAQLLDVARKYPSFPIILETVRECLQDVYDLPALKHLCADLGARRVRIAEITTDQPSPFASSLLFTYTGAFMYEGDTPLAEKRAAALALDPALLAKLLGTVELRELLDAGIIAEVHDQLQRTADGRRARSPEELADVLRIIGPVPVTRVHEHCTFGEPSTVVDLALDHLRDRVMLVRIAGTEHLAQSLDTPLLRDALGVPVPAGVAAQPATVTDALAQLVNRFARTRGPFTLADLADTFGLAPAAAHTALRQAVTDGTVIEGHYRAGVEGPEYCAVEVLRTIRSRSLALARSQAEPVSGSTFARFLTDWHQIAGVGRRPVLRGADGVYTVIEQLAGVRLPASAWETLVLPARVGDYTPRLLDELTATGEVLILGAGSAGTRDPWIMLLPADYAAQLAPRTEPPTLTGLQEAVLTVLRRGGGFHFAELLGEVSTLAQDDLDIAVPRGVEARDLADSLWELVELGLVSPDSFVPLRARLAGTTSGATAHRAKRRPTRNRLRMGRTRFAQAERANATAVSGPPDMVGRWAAAVTPATDPTTRSVAHGEAWLDRYGVVTRGSVVAEDVTGGFALAYKVLSSFEETGKAMRGYVIDGLGAAQFSTTAVIDRLRGLADTPDVEGWPSGTTDPEVVLLAAADPANPYGAALPWPDCPGARPTRSAGAVVVLADGLALAYLTRGGRSLTLFPGICPGGAAEMVALVVAALVDAVAAGRMSRFTVEKIGGEPALESPLVGAFRSAGAAITPKGLRLAGTSGTVTPRVARTQPGRSLAEAAADADAADIDLTFDDPPPGGGFRRPRQPGC
ncbi:DEAD/DEAH box helicase [Corynebacterium sp. CCM 9203]|uniref:DEAD/DEAH box helicase n=1 Tax=Corynebacterium sp. CCM 9203 TaxID=3057615 RepID=UPI00352413AE